MVYRRLPGGGWQRSLEPRHPTFYQHLGASNSISAALLRINNAPVYAAFLATNEPVSNASTEGNPGTTGDGFYVFAIDIPSGQKIWEFNNPYDKVNDSAVMASALDNSPPAGVTLVSKAGTALIDTVYVGDLEGSMFELNAQDGTNNTSYANALTTAPGTYATKCTANGLGCNFALINADGYDPNSQPQPISTAGTVFDVATDATASSPFYNYIGQTLLAFGTAGTAAVSALVPVVTGTIHVIPLAAGSRISPSTMIAQGTSAITNAQLKGVGIEVTGYPIGGPGYASDYINTGDQIFGSIVADGDHLYFATSQGNSQSIDARTGTCGASGNQLCGSTYSLNTTVGTTSAVTTIVGGTSGASSGGAGGTVLVVNNTAGTSAQVVTVTDQQINVTSGTVNAKAPSPSTPLTPTIMRGWYMQSSGREH